MVYHVIISKDLLTDTQVQITQFDMNQLGLHLSLFVCVYTSACVFRITFVHLSCLSIYSIHRHSHVAELCVCFWRRWKRE